MRAPCSNTRARTKSSSTASHRVREKPQLILSGAAAVRYAGRNGADGEVHQLKRQQRPGDRLAGAQRSQPRKDFRC